MCAILPPHCSLSRFLSLEETHKTEPLVMSGISFKITPPPRPTSGASSAAPSRPQSRSNSRYPSHHGRGPAANTEDDSEEDDDDAFRRAGGRDSKRRKVDEEEVVEFGKDGATR